MLTRDTIMTPEDFHALAKARGAAPRKARKAARIAARSVKAPEQVVTLWDGVETVNTAKPGDWIATSLDAAGAPLIDAGGAYNRYVIDAETFARTYAEVAPGGADGAVYAKRETVLALHLPDGFDILAPWGARQRGARGYLLLSGDEVYGNNAETFEATYVFID